MSWHCNACGGEHPDSLTVCRVGSKSGYKKQPYNHNARHCQHCGSEIPGTYDYCPCQSHWEGFADR